VINVPGGTSLGGVEGRPEYAGLGFVEIRFAFPGGGRGQNASGGTYDYRGPNCLRALADVIRFATGQLKDTQGRTVLDLVRDMTVLTNNVGLVGSSHGGNASGMVMATHGNEFPDLAFYASMESPYGEGNVNIELGGKDQNVNPAYNPTTGELDLSKLAWAADIPPGPPRRWREGGNDLRGALFFDLDGDGKFQEQKDYAANVFVQDLGQGPKAWYSPRLIREAERRKLFGSQRSAHLPTLAEATEYWQWRDAAGSISQAVRNCPKVAVIVYANERDHVQVAPDHPHILTQVEGFRISGAKFIRLNPDRAYVEKLVSNAPAPLRSQLERVPDNVAGIQWTRANIRQGLEPEQMPMAIFMQAAVCELADRVQANQWAPNLDAVLYLNTPSNPFGPRENLRPAERPGLLRQTPQDRPALPVRPAIAPAQPQAVTQLQTPAPLAAGDKRAPLLFCIGVHVEPMGATVSTLAGGRNMPSRPRPRAAPGSGPSYEIEGFFQRHVADLKTLADLVERQGGKLSLQVQTPFSRKLVETGNPLLRELEQRGHEIALHFHESSHLGPTGESLPPQTWTAVMQEEIGWLKKAGASRIRYWSGGNLYSNVLVAANDAGLDVMSDYKNPRTQKDDERLLAVNPWRPAAGPVEGDLAGFATHQPNGKIVYLPNGVFDRVDHSAMRRSVDTGGDYPYFDALTHGLELSLKAARPERVNVFHITVHAGEFRGGPQATRPFAVIEDWLTQVITPLVKAGKVKWATFTEMADAFRTWEKANPGQPARVVAHAQSTPSAEIQTSSPRSHITFVVNTHDFGRTNLSADTLLRLISIYERHHVRGDFYLTAPVVETYAKARPEVIERLKKSGMTISYHFRPPHPGYTGFDGTLRGIEVDALVSKLREYETYRLDLETGGLQRDVAGGYLYVKQTLGTAPVVASALSGNPAIKAALLNIYRQMGAQMTMIYHESGTRPEQPFEWRQGLLIRPSDFSVTRWAVPGSERENFWWNQLDTLHAAEYNPTEYLKRRLTEWKNPRPAFITVLIHENDFYAQGGPSWNAMYMREGGKAPLQPPYNTKAPDRIELRDAANQEKIWKTYEELVAYAATHLSVITSADLVKMAAAAKP
jgi:hypothetical protein